MTLVLLLQSTHAEVSIQACWPCGGNLQLCDPATYLDAPDLDGLTGFANEWGGRLAALIRNPAEANAYDDDAAEMDLHEASGEIVCGLSKAIDVEGGRLGRLALLICTACVETYDVRLVSLRLPEVSMYLALNEGWQPMMWRAVDGRGWISCDPGVALLVQLIFSLEVQPRGS